MSPMVIRNMETNKEMGEISVRKMVGVVLFLISILLMIISIIISSYNIEASIVLGIVSLIVLIISTILLEKMSGFLFLCLLSLIGMILLSLPVLLLLFYG